jgi:hypothetical protein
VLCWRSKKYGHSDSRSNEVAAKAIASLRIKPSVSFRYLEQKNMPTTLSRSIKTTEATVTETIAAPTHTNSVQTRVLLALWTLGEATRSDLKGSLIRKREKETAAEYERRVGICQAVIAQLEKSGAIETSSNKLSLSANGLEYLDQALLDPAFSFEAQIGAKTANALLKWIQQRMTATPSQTNGKPVSKAIASYAEFKTVVLEVFDRLNRDFNLNNLVPIYRIRREVGDRVSRSEFDEWLMEMQSQDNLQLIGGEMPEITPDKAEDSIKTALGGVRYYAKRP